MLDAPRQQMLGVQPADADQRAVEEIAGGSQMPGSLLAVAGDFGARRIPIALAHRVEGAHEVADRVAEMQRLIREVGAQRAIAANARKIRRCGATAEPFGGGRAQMNGPAGRGGELAWNPLR